MLRIDALARDATSRPYTATTQTSSELHSPARSPKPTIASGPSTRAGAPNNGTAAPNNRSQRQDYARVAAAHRARLDGGELLARGPRVDWATLLRRTFACEVLVCPRCTGRARVIAALHEPAEARRFLDSIDQRSIPTPLAHRTKDEDEPEVRSHDDDAFTDSYDPPSDEQEPPPSYEPPPPSSQPPAPRPDD